MESVFPIAISGGVATGKSTVAAWVQQQGFTVCSADSVARECFTSEECQSQLADYLGVEGPVLAVQVRDAILQSTLRRRAINRIMHPLVWDRVLKSNAQFVEVPLLIEACLLDSFRSVWVVTCSSEEQLLRLEARGLSRRDANRLVRAQIPEAVRLPFADLIIRTNEAIEIVMFNVQLALKDLDR